MLWHRKFTWNSNFGSQKWNFTGTQPGPFVGVLSPAVWAWEARGWLAVAEIAFKLFAIRPFKKKFAGTCSNLLTPLFQTFNSGSIVGGFQVQRLRTPSPLAFLAKCPQVDPSPFHPGSGVRVVFQHLVPSRGRHKQLPPQPPSSRTSPQGLLGSRKLTGRLLLALILPPVPCQVLQGLPILGSQSHHAPRFYTLDQSQRIKSHLVRVKDVNIFE